MNSGEAIELLIKAGKAINNEAGIVEAVRVLTNESRADEGKIIAKLLTTGRPDSPPICYFCKLHDRYFYPEPCYDPLACPIKKLLGV